MRYPRSMQAPRSTGRHYGLDWLRIAAFALLIVYHVAMVFAPWDWVIQTPHRYAALVAPMAALTPWRLPLLFAVSGYASRKLFERTAGPADFARSRAARLLVPLAFGMAVIVPPEMWVRALEHGAHENFLRFWATDYWRDFPRWEHLWFVVYLWAYSTALAGLVAVVGLPRLQAAIDRRTQGLALLWLPIAALGAAKLALIFVVPEEQGLFTDWIAHTEYAPIFVLGFAFGGSADIWGRLARIVRPTAIVALTSGIAVVALELTYQGHHTPGHAAKALERVLDVIMAWSMILLLFHVAQTRWNRDHAWRATLSEAVFPFYIVHHPVIVLLAWYTLPWGLNPWAEFALLLAGTAAACVAFYGVGREIAWLRPLIGLRARAAVRATPAAVPAT